MKITNITDCSITLLTLADRTAFDNRLDLKQQSEVKLIA